MYKRVLSLILCMCLVVTSCSNHKANSDDISVKKSIFDENKYELTAINSDKQGIDKSTAFQLNSKEKVNKKYIKDNLQIIPSQEYKIEEVSSTVHNIIPLSTLEHDKVYQVKLNDESHVYSWAFQTKKKFEVESTIPGKDSSYVPENSGIEMYFTLGNLDKIDEFFEIKPHVDGRFIQKEKSVIFVPEKLENDKRYTVTIKKGFGINKGGQKLEEDYVFGFTTYNQTNSQIYFKTPLSNIYENNAKVIEAYVDIMNKSSEYIINVYGYKNADDFAKNIVDFADTGKVDYNGKNISDVVFLNSVKQKPYVKNNSYSNKALFQLPEDLAKGYYLLEFYTDGSEEKYYQFLQINDMMIYNAFFDNNIFVMAADCKSSQGISKAEVYLNDRKLGITGKDGVLSSKVDTSSYKDKTIFMKIKAKGYSDFIYADNYNDYYENMNDAYKYLRYIDTDRTTYLPTDKVNVWGFARFRDDKSVNKLRIELVEQDTDLILDTKNVELTDIGTYQTEFILKNITSNYCVINVYDNETKISTQYISICEYTKPLYTLKGEFDKKYVYSGEKLTYKIKGNFFDGYPVSAIDVNYNTNSCYYNDSDMKYEYVDLNTKLDAKGESVINVNTDLKYNSWKPVTIDMYCKNGKAEDETVSDYDNFIIFPKRKMLEIEQKNINNPQDIDILFHELDNTKFDVSKLYYENFKNLRGKPLDGEITVDIYENYFEKVKIGEHYDFINKVNVVDYKYNSVKNKVSSEIANVSGGTKNIKIPEYKEDRNYEIIAYYEDEIGGIKEEFYVRGKYFYYNEIAYYSLEKTDNKESYRINEDINLQLKYNNKNVEDIENNNMIILLMRDGLVDYKVLDSTKAKFNFAEDYLPNVLLNCFYIKNGYMYPVECYDNICYDRTEKQINFDVTTDKENYRPGEEVVLNIKAYDEDNKPCVADVNISVVDEAYFALFEKRVNTLGNLYAYSWDRGLKRTYLSNIESSLDEGNMAERGGGGGEDNILRDEFKDTNIFRTIRTDKNGKAVMKFKLADNLTSWRITYQGISDKQFAGSGTKNITVSLPFFVDLIMGKEYQKEDKINAVLRVFGTEAKESETVNYKVTVKNKSSGSKKEYNLTGIVGEYTNVFLDRLDEGQYEIFVDANCKNLKDSIKEEFNVVDSSIYFNNTSYYKLSDSTVLKQVYSNPVITLFNESSSDFYNSLNSVASGNGKRIDQTICQMAACKYINENFNTDLYYNEEEMLKELNKYKSFDGGLKLLSYSESDAEVTAKLINTVNNDYLNSKIKKYFKNKLDNTEEYDTKVAASLWGLSKLKEPVLLTVYDLLENNKNLEARDKLYLALALSEFGDDKTARKYYKEFIEQGVKSSGDYLYFEGKKDLTDNYELTALLSVLGVKLKDFDNSDKLFRYLYNKPLRTTLSNFEQLIYIMNRDIMSLKEIQDLFGEVTVTSGGSKKTYKLKLFDRESFAVTKDKIKDIKFSNIKGSIACKVEALGNKDDLNNNKTNDFSLDITYMLKDSSVEQMQYKQSDLVKVTITPSFSSKILRGFYEITYVIPSGFRYVDNDRIVAMWPEINGQKVIFNMYYDKVNLAVEPAVFYIQAAQTGEYTVDYVVMKEYLESKLNYINKMTLSVK